MKLNIRGWEGTLLGKLEGFDKQGNMEFAPVCPAKDVKAAIEWIALFVDDDGTLTMKSQPPCHFCEIVCSAHGGCQAVIPGPGVICHDGSVILM